MRKFEIVKEMNKATENTKPNLQTKLKKTNTGIGKKYIQ
jgi:hypothetical protein